MPIQFGGGTHGIFFKGGSSHRIHSDSAWHIRVPGPQDHWEAITEYDLPSCSWLKSKLCYVRILFHGSAISTESCNLIDFISVAHAKRNWG